MAPPSIPRSNPPRDAAAVGVELAGATTATVREGGTDLGARAGVRIGFGEILALHMSAGLVRATGGPVDAWELPVTVGFGARLRPLRWLTLDASLALGVSVHHYALTTTVSQAPSGTHVDFLATLPLRATLWPLRWLGVAFDVTPGLAAGARRHLLDGVVLWERGAPRLEAGVGLVFRAR